MSETSASGPAPTGCGSTTAKSPQMLSPGVGHRNELTASRLTMTPDKASVVGFFPYGKARARGPPRIEHLGIGTRARAQPFKEIQDKVVEIVRSGLTHCHAPFTPVGTGAPTTRHRWQYGERAGSRFPIGARPKSPGCPPVQVSRGGSTGSRHGHQACAVRLRRSRTPRTRSPARTGFALVADLR